MLTILLTFLYYSLFGFTSHKGTDLTLVLLNIPYVSITSLVLIVTLYTQLYSEMIQCSSLK